MPTRSHFRELLRERQKVPHRAIFSLSTGVDRWPWNHPPGDQCPHWIQGAGFSLKLVAGAQTVLFHG